MAKNRLGNEDFFTQLSTLFSSTAQKSHGSVFLTQKRLAEGPALPSSDPLADLHLEKPVPILVRATDGGSKERRPSRIKLATVVQPGDMESFFTKYADVCKGGMSGLKKRDRSKRKRDKAKKKKAGTDPEKKG